MGLTIVDPKGKPRFVIEDDATRPVPVEEESAEEDEEEDADPTTERNEE